MSEKIFHDSAETPITSLTRWKWTRRLSRLGAVGAVVLGASIALDLGGAWNAELLAWLFGLPFSLPLAWNEVLYPSAQNSPADTWSWVHVALGVSAVASWTMLGAAIDWVRSRKRPPAVPPTLPPVADSDRYLEAAQADVESLLRGEDRVREPRRGPLEFFWFRATARQRSLLLMAAGADGLGGVAVMT